MNYYFNISCNNEIKGNNALFIIMTVISVFVCFGSLFSDHFGRKPLFIVVSVISLFGSFVSLLKNDFNFIVAGVAVQNLCKGVYFFKTRYLLVLYKSVFLHE